MTDWLILASGLFLLVVGAEALVRGASGLALIARITPAVVGLTVVAAGTSMPELVVSVQASLQGDVGIAAGNIVGSNVFNIGAILGLCALVRPLRIQSNSVKLEWPVMFAAALVFLLMSRDGAISRTEAAVLLLGLVAFVGQGVRLGRRESARSDPAGFGSLTTASFGREGGAALAFNSVAVLLGVGLLAGGSTLLVTGAGGIARSFGVPDTLIGLTIVAAGTSTPELVTSLMAAFRGKDDIAVANVLGSNIFNVLGIGGLAAAIKPLAVPAEIVERDNLWMLALSILLLPFMRTGMRLGRLEGLILLAIYLTWVGLLVTKV